MGITPNAASSISAYYSATAQYVSWVHQLPNTAHWAGGQDLTQHDSKQTFLHYCTGERLRVAVSCFRYAAKIIANDS